MATYTIPEIKVSVRTKGEASESIKCSSDAVKILRKIYDADISLTRKVQKGGELLDIKLLDHIIVTKSGYNSLSESGMM